MILVFCELKDGQLRKPSAEALSEGRRLADACGKQLGALFVGASCAGAADAALYGADVILTAEGGTLASYSSDAFAQVVADAVKAKGATVLLAAATAVGKDVAPRAAARLAAGYASDVTGLSMVDGKLQAVRPVYAGKKGRRKPCGQIPALSQRHQRIPANPVIGLGLSLIHI